MPTLPSSAQSGTPETILLVEDDVSLRFITEFVLQRHGYHVIVAETGAEALAAFNAEPDSIDLVLTDILLAGGISGQELAHRLLAVKPTLKLIFTSGRELKAIDSIPLVEGVNFLKKPFEIDTMLGAIRGRLDAD